MKLFLLRHAAAENTCPDSSRMLSAGGLEQISALALRVDACAFSNLVQIWHSPYVRAEQTAKIFAETLALNVPLETISNITPEDDPRKAACALSQIAGMGCDLLVVGHNPHLEALAALLVFGDMRRPIVRFDNCSLLSLELLEAPNAANEHGIWMISEFLS
jgi:phosphohistidine phosphatase SixA